MSDLTEQLEEWRDEDETFDEEKILLSEAITALREQDKRITELEGFERIVKMSGQDAGLRLMDAEAKIEQYEQLCYRIINDLDYPIDKDGLQEFIKTELARICDE